VRDYISPAAIARMTPEELATAGRDLRARKRAVEAELDELEELLSLVEERDGTTAKRNALSRWVASL